MYGALMVQGFSAPWSIEAFPRFVACLAVMAMQKQVSSLYRRNASSAQIPPPPARRKLKSYSKKEVTSSRI